MRLNIDFDNKVITLLDKVNIDTLSKSLKKMFPDTWKEFTLDTNTSVVYSYYPHYYWYNGSYTSTPTLVANTTSSTISSDYTYTTSQRTITSGGSNLASSTSNVYAPEVLAIPNPVSVNNITSGTYCIEVGEIELETT